MKQWLERLPGYKSAVIPWHILQGVFWACRYGFPARGMTVVGVTGTNGKTTTCLMIYRMLVAAGKKVGVITTVGEGMLGEFDAAGGHMTTWPARQMNEKLAAMRRAGVRYLVLEVSSHALAQHRTLGVRFRVAVMTNLTQEHLNFHGTMERYAAAKMRLFRMAGMGVVNAEDEWGARFARASRKAVAYGLEKGDVTLGKMPVKPELPGDYNKANALAAAAVGEILGLSRVQILEGIASLKEAPGRMQVVDEGQKYTVIVDYAHTPDAMERVLAEGRKMAGRRRLIVCFGAQGGNRDPGKRRPMGEIAGRLADVVVLTEDESYETPVTEIMADIAEGVVEAGKALGKDLFLEERREKAVALAVSLARAGDVVMFLGKGHEKTISRASGEEVYDEVAEVEKAIRKDSRAG